MMDTYEQHIFELLRNTSFGGAVVDKPDRRICNGN
jgi:hypothetical protein